MSSHKRIFITGGAGFIGSNLVKSLYEKGFIIKVYDNFSSGSLQKLEILSLPLNSSRLNIVKGNILEKKKLTNEMKGADIVIHHAAQLEITKAVSDPYYDLSSNTIGTLNILEAMIQNRISNLINASSACVYGQKSRQNLPTTESSGTNPNWAYGVSKLAAEKYIAIYSELYGIRAFSARYGIVYGPNEWIGRAMPIFIKRALQKKDIIIFGDGSPLRDFIHVDDVASWNMLATARFSKLKSKKGLHVIHNVSTGKGTSIITLAKEVKKRVKKKHGIEINLIIEPVDEGKKSKYMNRVRLPMELKAMVLDPAKAQNDLNWNAKITLDEGLNDQMDWANAHLYTWKKISY